MKTHKMRDRKRTLCGKMLSPDQCTDDLSEISCQTCKSIVVRKKK